MQRLGGRKSLSFLRGLAGTRGRCSRRTGASALRHWALGPDPWVLPPEVPVPGRCPPTLRGAGLCLGLCAGTGVWGVAISDLAGAARWTFIVILLIRVRLQLLLSPLFALLPQTFLFGCFSFNLSLLNEDLEACLARRIEFSLISAGHGRVGWGGVVFLKFGDVSRVCFSNCWLDFLQAFAQHLL